MEKIFTAKSIEEAKELAISEFGVSSDEITFEVIEDAKKGLFGKIKSEAKIKALYSPSKAQHAAAYIKEILVKMGVNPELTVTENEDNAVIDIEGDGLGTVIGRRGETLDALQYLASLVCNKGDKDYYRINVDSCGYRDKRKTTLEELAQKISKSVLKSGRSVTLEPMNPYERRIIHSAISEVEGVSSRSTGEEPHRRVVISSDRRPPRNNNGGKFNKDNKDNKGRRNKLPNGPRSLDLKTSFEKDYKKPKPEDSIGSGLYSKIEI